MDFLILISQDVKSNSGNSSWKRDYGDYLHWICAIGETRLKADSKTWQIVPMSL